MLPLYTVKYSLLLKGVSQIAHLHTAPLCRQQEKVVHLNYTDDVLHTLNSKNFVKGKWAGLPGTDAGRGKILKMGVDILDVLQMQFIFQHFNHSKQEVKLHLSALTRLLVGISRTLSRG